ncbi:MAG: TauD/TfdA family dioxygenase [Proteobacteria bacterium]|nr:TauD/TfdA family dioxygenase [Pseudomonadota bacterium]
MSNATGATTAGFRRGESRFARRLAPYSAAGLEIIPAEAPLGAEVRGIDLAKEDPGDEAVEAMRAAWAEHLVLLWRDQTLTPERQVEVARLFGEPEDMSRVGTDEAGLPKEIIEIENDPAKNASAGASDRYAHGLKYHELNWHSDNSYRELPPDGSLFYVREAPAEGGATNFCNMYLACDDLPADLLAKVRGRVARHDTSHNSANVLRKGFRKPRDASEGIGPEHPIVRLHPVSGRRALYLGRRPYCYIPGYALAESEAILDRLWAHATDQRYAWRRRPNRPGDLILWDNRCTMHMREPFDPRQRRLAHRVQLLGAKPIMG